MPLQQINSEHLTALDTEFLRMHAELARVTAQRDALRTILRRFHDATYGKRIDTLAPIDFEHARSALAACQD